MRGAAGCASLVCLLAAGLAGCIGFMDDPGAGTKDAPMALSHAEIMARLTQPRYESILREEAVVPGADGAGIWVNVFRPEDAPGPVPVLLVKTPYQVRNTLAAIDPSDPLAGCREVPPGGCPYSAWLVDHFAPRGYAVAFSDVRGNHNAGGCSDQSGPKQWQDGYAVVEWLGARDWSSGKVGMYGASYDAETQVSTALLNPPSLVTIVPTASVSNQYEYSFYDGVPYSTGALRTSLAYLGISLLPGTHPNAVTSYPERLACQPEVFGAAADMSGDWSAYWEDRDYRVLAPGIQASVLQTHGLQDWNVKPNHLDGFFNSLTSEKRLIIGQWEHAFPYREDWRFIVHRWFDHYLHGIDTGILEDLPPVLVEDSGHAWRAMESFPPASSAEHTLFLSADGTLAASAPARGKDVLHDHPRRVYHVGLPFLDDLGESATGHPSALRFESAPLETALHYSGRPVLHLVATTAAARTHWAVHLVEVDEHGGESIINRGYFNTRHIDGLDAPRDLAEGETYELAVRLFPQDDVIAAGSRLRLVLTNVDDWTKQDDTYAASTVLFGPQGTRFTLPVAPAGTPVPPDALRDALRPDE